jgi:hypothetical protein
VATALATFSSSSIRRIRIENEANVTHKDEDYMKIALRFPNLVAALGPPLHIDPTSLPDNSAVEIHRRIAL